MQSPTGRRCEFLQEVSEHLEGILENVMLVSQQVRKQTADRDPQQEPGSSKEGGDEFGGGEPSSEGVRAINQAVDAFRTSVFAVSELCHAQIEGTPVPSRMNKAPYILELAHENMKEAAAIEMRYMVHQ